MSAAIRKNAGSAPCTNKRRWSGMARVAAAAAFLFATGGPAVIAQYDDSAATYWRQERQRQRATSRPAATRTVEQRPTRLIRGSAPKKGFTRVVPETDKPASPDHSPADPSAPVTADAPGAAPPAPTQQAAGAQQAALPALRIVVLGDNIAQQLARGLEIAYGETPAIAIARHTRDSSGLVNTRFHDWADATTKLLASGEKIDIAVMMLGSNDAQDIQDGRERHRVRTEEWVKLYRTRIETVLAQFREKKIPLVWVGMPIMRGEKLAGEMLAFNEIYRETVQRAGGVYVDVWEAFVDDRNKFTLFGPDVNGEVVKLRTGDGVHFTPAGARKLAYFLESPLKRLIDEKRPRTDPMIAALAPPQPPTAAQQAPSAIPPLQADVPPQATAPVVAPERPAAGPIVRLTQPVVAPDGELAASRRGPNAAPVLSALAQRRLVEGAAIEAQPGRADDFSWPRR